MLHLRYPPYAPAYVHIIVAYGDSVMIYNEGAWYTTFVVWELLWQLN